jgi:ADP-ribose pyrophosphatase
MPDRTKDSLRPYGWEHFETDYPFTHHMFRIRQDTVRWPDCSTRPYTYVEASAAVFVVPETTLGQIVLIRQVRYTAGDWIWEVPAGGFHDFEGSPEDLARRELAEEVGGSGDRFEYIGWFRPGTSLIDQICHIVLARGVRLDCKPKREPAEVIEVHPTSTARALEMARGGAMIDGCSALALLRCEPLLTRPAPQT